MVRWPISSLNANDPSNRDDWHTEASYLEERMDILADEATELHRRAYDAYDQGDIETADRLIDEGDAKWNEFSRIKRELGDMESGW